MNGEELERHTQTFRRAYARFPNMEESARVKWADRIANSIPLQLAYSLTGAIWPTHPFEPADYTEDGLKPEGKR